MREHNLWKSLRSDAFIRTATKGEWANVQLKYHFQNSDARRSAYSALTGDDSSL